VGQRLNLYTKKSDPDFRVITTSENRSRALPAILEGKEWRRGGKKKGERKGREAKQAEEIGSGLGGGTN